MLSVFNLPLLCLCASNVPVNGRVKIIWLPHVLMFVVMNVESDNNEDVHGKH